MARGGNAACRNKVMDRHDRLTAQLFASETHALNPRSFAPRQPLTRPTPPWPNQHMSWPALACPALDNPFLAPVGSGVRQPRRISNLQIRQERRKKGPLDCCQLASLVCQQWTDNQPRGMSINLAVMPLCKNPIDLAPKGSPLPGRS